LAAAAIGILVFAANSAFAQGGTPGGFPQQTDLYNDALTLARAIPIILALGIGFGIWEGKRSMRERKSSPDSPSVIRHDIGTVIAHWANGIGFMIGMITGAMVLRWVQRPDEMRIVFAIHYIGSSLVVFAVGSHLAQNFVTGGFGLIPRSLRDPIYALSELIEYTGVFGPSGAALGISWPKALRQPFAGIIASFGLVPPRKIGKFLPAEKVASYTPWAIIISVMLVTGLVKALRYEYYIPPDFVAQMSTIHDLFTIVAIAMLGIHLCAVLLVPRHWPLVVSIFTTRIPRAFVAKWHPLWLQQLEAAEKQQAAASQPAAQPVPAAQAKARP
jgi:cytochrome b subunit of formate dehydrogenase